MQEVGLTRIKSIKHRKKNNEVTRGSQGNRSLSPSTGIFLSSAARLYLPPRLWPAERGTRRDRSTRALKTAIHRQQHRAERRRTIKMSNVHVQLMGFTVLLSPRGILNKQCIIQAWFSGGLSHHRGDSGATSGPHGVWGPAVCGLVQCSHPNESERHPLSAHRSLRW